MEPNREQAKAEHDHQDPRGPAAAHDRRLDAAHVDPRKVNAGAMKARGTPRLDPVVNWGRKAAHPKEE